MTRRWMFGLLAIPFVGRAKTKTWYRTVVRDGPSYDALVIATLNDRGVTDQEAQRMTDALNYAFDRLRFHGQLKEPVTANTEPIDREG